jgi:hypothetical protein
MGVLEDAIREHLDLRRQHGAAEDELRDQEAEALGPARREDEPEPEPFAGGDALPEPSEEPTRLVEAPPPDETDMPFDGATEGDTTFERDERPGPEPVLEDEPFVSDETMVLAEPLPEPEPLVEDEPVREEPDVEETVVEEPVLEEPVVEETVVEEPVVEEPVTEVGSPFDEPFADEPEAGEEPPPAVPPSGSEDEGEDVLEETPDFLSETPEHDRLWFEQKPPRDFDFD